MHIEEREDKSVLKTSCVPSAFLLFFSPAPLIQHHAQQSLSLGPAVKALTRVVRLHDGHDKGMRKKHGCTLPHALKLHSIALEHDPMHVSLCAQAKQVPGHCVTLAHVQARQVREQKPINGWKKNTHKTGQEDETRLLKHWPAA